MKKWIAALICAGGTIVGLIAQTTTTPPKTPTFKAGSEEVVLDVVVRDKKGHLVKDLKQDSFSVTDNGEKRSIHGFRLVEGSEAVGANGVRHQLDPLRQIRLVTLLFEGLDQDARKRSRDAGLSLLKSELAPNVYMSVMTIDHKLEALQTFTNNRDLIKKAIDRATGGTHEFSSDNLQVKAQLEQLLGPNQGGAQGLADRAASMSNGASGTSGASAAPNGPSAADAAMAQMMLRIVNATGQDVATDQGRAVIYALLAAVKEQYLLPGRKTLLLFSNGFRVPQGMEEEFQSVVSTANRSNVSFYAIDAHGLSTTNLNGGATGDLASAAAASRANARSNGSAVSIEMARSVDASLESGRANTQDTLARLANETGGALIANTNDFQGPLRKINEDIQTYYEISYDPDIQKYDGSFRKVSVKTEDSDLRVQSRMGYFALPPEMAASGNVVTAYEVPLLQALDAKPLPRSFAFQSAGMHFRGATGTPTCEVVVDVPIGNLTLKEDPAGGAFAGQFAYVALVKDAQGQIVKKFNQQVPLHISADQVDAYKKTSHFVSAEHFDLTPGRYTLETAVMDEKGEKMSARKSVFMVPGQASALALSSVAVIRGMKEKEPTTTAGDPLLMGGKVVSPTVNPIVRKSDGAGVPFYMVIYPDKGAAEKPTLKMIFSRDGQVLGSGSPPLGAADAEGRIQYVATAPTAALEPGNYQVEFVAKQGAETAAESVTFTLEQ